MWIRNVDLGVGRNIKAVVLDAAADADDGNPIFAVTNPFSKRALVRPEPPGEHFVDDGDAGRALVVALGEIASLFERDLEGGEIAGTDWTNLGVVLNAGRGRLFGWRASMNFVFDGLTFGSIVAPGRTTLDTASRL